MEIADMATGSVTNVGRILCPIDLSGFSQSVLAYAAAFANLFGSEVTVLHVLATAVPPATLGTDPAWLLQVPESRDSMASELDALLAPLSSTGVTVRTQIAEGHTSAEIVRYAADHDVDLIVMGTHGRSGFDRLALGSVAEKVLRKAPCPVLTVPPGAACTVHDVLVRRILCPTDFSLFSERAMDLALSLAEKADATVTALHVVETLDTGPGVSGPMAELRKRQCDTELHALADINAARAGGNRITNTVRLGRPYLEILRLADERTIDVIVMGVRGRGAVDITLFGSTTNQVVRRAKCPVVTIRPRPHVDR